MRISPFEIQHQLNRVSGGGDFPRSVVKNILEVEPGGFGPMQNRLDGERLIEGEGQVVVNVDDFDGCKDPPAVKALISDAAPLSQGGPGVFEKAGVPAMPHDSQRIDFFESDPAGNRVPQGIHRLIRNRKVGLIHGRSLFFGMSVETWRPDFYPNTRRPSRPLVRIPGAVYNQSGLRLRGGFPA